jgi:hypothetical protein
VVWQKKSGFTYFFDGCSVALTILASTTRVYR